MPYPKISIVFCTKCKWNLRSAWYLQELLQTFGDNLGEVSLIPGESGEFKIIGQLDAKDQKTCIWDRKVNDGFPDSKLLKQKVRSILFENEVSIGKHNERKGPEQLQTQNIVKEEENCEECHNL